MLGRLRRPAAGNEDGLVFPIGACRPEEMIVRPAFLPVLPEPSIFLEIVDGRRVGMAFVKGTHLLRDISCIPSCCLLFHDAGVARKDPMHGSDRAWVGDTKARRRDHGARLRSIKLPSAGQPW